MLVDKDRIISEEQGLEKKSIADSKSNKSSGGVTSVAIENDDIKLSAKANIFIPATKLDESEKPEEKKIDGTCHSSNSEETTHTLLQIQELQVMNKKGQHESVVGLWDAGSTLCFITFKVARKLQLQGDPIALDIITVGGNCRKVNSQKYTIWISDGKGSRVAMEVLGIDQISTEIERIDVSKLMKGFKSPEASQFSRPMEGNIDLLIGYQYAAYHPVPIESVGHLLLMKNMCGVILAGSHPDCEEMTKKIVKHATVLHSTVTAEDFYNIESLGVSCTPSCGSCKCGHCHPGGKNMTLLEERELEMIENGLQFDESTGRWLAKYPWLVDPNVLPRNRHVAFATLKSTEKRLSRNPLYCETYRGQIDDMLERKVARHVSKEELKEYTGPKFYISHHDVLKPDSSSTPLRIVFNSSAKIKGMSLNGCLAKGPSLLNNIFGILLRFRQEQLAFIGDISKMFHSIDIPIEDQMTHLFLWRNLQSEKEPDTYAMTVVNMGDRPAAAIAQTALRKTAEESSERFPEASKIILRNSYMDDIPGSVKSDGEGTKIMSEATEILGEKGFKIKGWMFSGQKKSVDVSKDQKAVQVLLNKAADDDIDKVLGMEWDTEADVIKFESRKFDRSRRETTKRQCLSTVYSIYDPVGLLTPVTVAAKIILRKVWAARPHIDWDDPLPTEIQRDWDSFRESLDQIRNLTFKRSIKPSDGEVPVLIFFSDGSQEAYGVAAYIRWKTSGGYVSNLLAAKSRIAPLKIIDVVRLELCGAVLNSRLYVFIKKEMPDVEFNRIYHIVDSEIVKAMINKDSYGFNTFAANRIGEIHRNTKSENWYWIEGKLNIADITTRGCDAAELNEDSTWQNGPDFLKLPESEWPILSETTIADLPERKKQFVGIVAEASQNHSLATVIDIQRFSKVKMLLNVTALIMKLYSRFKSGGDKLDTDISTEDTRLAERMWIKDAQRSIFEELEDVKYKKLHPTVRDDILVVIGRTERWMEATWNNQYFILLPKKHRLSYLIALHEHQSIGHLGTESTVAVIRSKYWIMGIRKIVSSIINKCVKCKIKFKRLAEQRMSTLPIERIKPSPAFRNVGLDYFGPFATKGEVQKRTRGKGYGIIITCDVSRAVYVDMAPDYGTPSFLLALRRFASFRGWPHKIHSDPGSQLKSAATELQNVVKELDWAELKKFGHEHSMEWSFSPADSKWYNGSTEALVKTIKRALEVTIGQQVFTFSEFLTIMYEASELANERPIGRKPTHPDDGTYLCPNDLLMGRSSTNIPQGPFSDKVNPADRFRFIQTVINNFWKRWSREVFPSLVIQPKWHVERRNVMIGDVVLLQDSNVVRGEWKMGIISEITASKDGLIRRVNVTYKRDSTSYTVSRAVLRLIVLVPKDEESRKKLT